MNVPVNQIGDQRRLTTPYADGFAFSDIADNVLKGIYFHGLADFIYIASITIEIAGTI